MSTESASTTNCTFGLAKPGRDLERFADAKKTVAPCHPRPPAHHEPRPDKNQGRRMRDLHLPEAERSFSTVPETARTTVRANSAAEFCCRGAQERSTPSAKQQRLRSGGAPGLLRRRSPLTLLSDLWLEYGRGAAMHNFGSPRGVSSSWPIASTVWATGPRANPNRRNRALESSRAWITHCGAPRGCTAWTRWICSRTRSSTHRISGAAPIENPTWNSLPARTYTRSAFETTQGESS